jgi:hypothetical protein
MDAVQFASSPSQQKYMISVGPAGHVMMNPGNPAGGGLGLGIGALLARLRRNRGPWHVDVALLDQDNRPTGGTHHEQLADQAKAEERAAEIMRLIGEGAWTSTL